jgi:polar amino acid transport system permease protein
MEFWVVQRNLHLLLEGVKNTLILAATGISGGIILGLFVAIAQMSKISVIRWLAIVYKEIFRCAPLIVMIIWLYYCLPALVGIRLPAMWVAILALIGYGGACFGETFRSGLQAIPPEQRDAAKSLNLSGFQTYVYVLIPQLLRIVLPPTISWSISILKESSIASVIAVNELMFVSRTLSHETYLPFEFLTAAAILYYIIAAPMENVVSYLENRLREKIAA